MAIEPTRSWQVGGWLVCVCGLWAGWGGDVRAEVKMTTHVYRRVAEHEIKADVYREDSNKAARRPVVVWIHGGAMINGHRAGLFAPIQQPLLEQGCVVVSIDYRLAPESKLPDLISDVEEAFGWIRKEGPRLFAADPDRIAVFGGSAGGYLALVAGYRVSPRPKALVSLWGYGDLVGPWAIEKSPHARHQQAIFTDADAERLRQGAVVSDSRQRKGDGGGFYQHSRRTGTWPAALTGWDPRTTPEKFYPFMPLKNVTPEYPPTLFIHGEADTDVPFEQSELMVAELKRHRVEHELVRFPGAEHGLPGVDKQALAKTYTAAAAFLLKHLKSAGP